MVGNKAYLTIDAGGTYLKSAILNSDGKVFQDSIISVKSFSDKSEEKILWAFREITIQGIEYIRGKGMELRGIGIAIPGPFDIENAIPLMKHKFREIYGINLREYFYNIPGVHRKILIKFIHDANAVLAGEIWKGNAQSYNNSAVVTLGTGLGFAISQNNEILYNEHGGPFLSIFKLPYKNGILEDYVSKRGFINTYKELSGQIDVDRIKVSDIGKWAREGDKVSIHTFCEVGRILAISLQPILTERNIQCLLFGGQISRSFKYMEGTIKEGLKDVNCLSNISVVKSIENAAIYGAFQSVAINSNKIIYKNGIAHLYNNEK